jgi:hypothetical protein
MLRRLRILLLALVAVAAVAAPAATATPPVSDSLDLELELFDLSATTACGGIWVFANVEGVIERRLYFASDGSVSHQIETFQGRIEWFTRDSGKSYSSALVNKVRIDFPEGTDLFKPAKITVTGMHGGVFPIGGGPAGTGTLHYDGFVYASDDAGFQYWATDGGPTSMSGNFEATNRRICAALA